MTATATRARVVEALQPVIAAAGYDLEDVSVSSAGKRRLLRVVVDKDGGVSLDDVADISRAISESLDESDSMGGAAYVLEVTSPGVDRPLTEPRHWRRARGRLVKLVGRDGGAVTGRVTGVGEDGTSVTLDVDGRDVTYPLGDVARAVVQVEFGRAESDVTDNDLADNGDANDEDEGTDRGDDAEEGQEEPPA